MNMRIKTRKNNIKSNIIKRQSNEINDLKKKIENLDITCKQKDELIQAIDYMRYEFEDVLQDLRNKRNEYDNLINELDLMKRLMNKEVFKGRWNIIRFLLK